MTYCANFKVLMPSAHDNAPPSGFISCPLGQEPGVYFLFETEDQELISTDQNKAGGHDRSTISERFNNIIVGEASDWSTGISRGVLD